MIPSVELNINMTPKWIGSIPYCVAIPSKMELSMTLMAIPSKNVPRNNTNAFNIIRATIFDETLPNINAANFVGISSSVSILPNPEDTPRINSIVHVVITVL